MGASFDLNRLLDSTDRSYLTFLAAARDRLRDMNHEAAEEAKRGH